MNAKIIFTIISMCIAVNTGLTQIQETTDSLTLKLNEVIVTARQPVTKLVGTTLVSTIPGSNLADIGNALDVLAQLPMIRVQDNAVSVISKSDVEIYIDGHPMHDQLELQQILSSNLKKVELQMAPGAAYKNTTGAVLRITTKRNFIKGLSLSDQFLLQRQRRWSVMDNIDMKYRTGNWEFFINGSINHDNKLIKGTTLNTLMYDGRETVVGSRQHNSYTTTAGTVRTGFYYTKDKLSAGAYYRYNPERGNFINSGTEWLDNTPALNREIDKDTRAGSHLFSAYFENTFADKYLLHFDGDFKQSSGKNSIGTTYPESAQPDVNSTDHRESKICAGKLYLEFPLWNGSFTVGTQDSYTHTTLDYRMLNVNVEEYIPSSLSDARQTSAALFASWSRMFGKLSLSAGARYEYVNYDFKTDGKRDEDVSRRDHLLTPDLSIGYNFNDDAQISLSYRMTTVKPPYSQLTGALNYVGLHEIEGGNPSLLDEKMHDVRLFSTWNGFMLYTDYIRSINSYAYVKQLYPAENLQLIMHPVNIDVSALNVYMIWSKQVNWWTPDITVGMYRQWLTLDHTRYNRPIFSYYFDNTFSLPHGWIITANISGQTQGDMHTNRFGTTPFTMDASIGKTLINRSLTIKLSATDIFNTANNDWTMNTFGVHVDKRQSYDRRGLQLNIIYNFQPRKSAYKGNSAAEAEMKRL